MATLTIQDVEDSVAEKLRVRAAKHGRSTEDVEPFGGFELELPPREKMPDPPRFD
jgi:hypothetical protein